MCPFFINGSNRQKTTFQGRTMTGCCVENCHNRDEKGYVMLRFPKDPVLKAKWVQAINNKEGWMPNANSRICEAHFLPSQWIKYGWRLKPTEIPSIFCSCTSNKPDVVLPDKCNTALEEFDNLFSEHSYVKSKNPNLSVPGALTLGVAESCDKAKSSDIAAHQHVNVCTINKDYRENVQSGDHIYSKTVRASQNIARNCNPQSSSVTESTSGETTPGNGDHFYSPTTPSLKTADIFQLHSYAKPVGANEQDCALHTYKENRHPLPTSSGSDCRDTENLPPSADLEKRDAAIRHDTPGRVKRVMKVLKEQNSALKSKVAKVQAELSATKKELEKVKNSGVMKWTQGTFSKEQIAAATFGYSRGSRWSDEDIRKGIQLKYTCGTTGYKQISKILVPLPSPRTLLRRIEHVKFEPGILHEILAAVAEEVRLFSPNQRDCGMFFDDMSIQPQVDLDRSTGKFIGGVTLPGVSGQATKAMVIMIGGIQKRYKFPIAYHFVPNETHVDSLSSVVLEALTCVRDIGLNVLALICDMGNRALLAALGFSTTKENMVYQIQNPADPSKKLFLVPDTVHLNKSLFQVFITNEIITLDPDTVKEEQLPSREIDIGHLVWLEEYQKDMDLKFVPQLKLRDLQPTHFNKMKVAPSRHVISHAAGSALSYLVEKGIGPKEFETTAWFLKLMNRWFLLMTSRTFDLAISKKNLEAYTEAISFLRRVVTIMRRIRVKGRWKVVQTHIIMATEAILCLQDYLLNEKGYDFVLVGRFLQDIIENLFSLIRLMRPNPRPLDFKHRLREITIGQLSLHIANSSYDLDDREHSVNLLLKKPSTSQEESSSTVPALSWVEPTTESVKVENDVLYRVCGYVIFELIKRKVIQCKECIERLQHRSPTPHPNSMWVDMTNYSGGDRQIRPSDEVYQLLRRINFNLWSWKTILTNSSCAVRPIVQSIINDHVQSQSLSTCHDTKQQIVDYFVNMRLQQFSSKNNRTLVSTPTALASKSTGSRYLADRYTGTGITWGTKGRKYNRSIQRLAELP